MSDASDSSEESDSEEETPPKKRKADAEAMPAPKKAKTENNPEGLTSLFVGQLSWNVDDEWLGREFSEIGTVTGARVITDKETGRSRGYVIS